ncbi:MAG: 3-oxoacyl-ACP synthase III [Planctomycetota bacterium]|nr:3-oxoacyl-ACP synthase III [Planctomycetota bacterium]
MRFDDVRVQAVAHVLPEETVTSEELEERLGPVYDRLRLRIGRLELMTGIRERRFWPPGTRPSDVAARAGALALERSGLERERIGCLIHAAVCRDFMEPATASVVHRLLELPPACMAFDLSNACLGVTNAMIVIARMIEHGDIEAGLVVAGEDGRGLVEETIRNALADPNLTREDFKGAFASLTIGSGAAAIALSRADDERGRRLTGGAVLADTAHYELCLGDRDEGLAGPLMTTDSEALLQAGNALASRTFERFREELGWERESIDRIVTHQVGSAHRRLLFETLQIDPAIDFPTVETLGNIGSVSLPLSLSMALDADFIRPGQRVAMLAIGSGLHCLMLGLEW